MCVIIFDHLKLNHLNQWIKIHLKMVNQIRTIQPAVKTLLRCWVAVGVFGPVTSDPSHRILKTNPTCQADVLVSGSSVVVNVALLVHASSANSGLRQAATERSCDVFKSVEPLPESNTSNRHQSFPHYQVSIDISLDSACMKYASIILRS